RPWWIASTTLTAATSASRKNCNSWARTFVACPPEAAVMRTDGITIALTKGRILDDALPLLAEAGIRPLESIADSRKLLFPTNCDGVRLLVLRGQDVLTYVRYGAADVGLCGKDMLLEYGADDTYELLDLRIARCRLMTAAPIGAGLPAGRLRVA